MRHRAATPQAPLTWEGRPRTLRRTRTLTHGYSRRAIFLQAYVPKLQSVGWVCQFLRWQRGYEIPSSAAFGKIGDAYAAEVHRWAKAHGVPVRRFAKGESKEVIARPLIEAAEREGGDGRVVLIGIAQEKTPVWRSWKAKDLRTRPASAHGVGPADGLREPCLLLPVGSRVGWDVLEVQTPTRRGRYGSGGAPTPGRSASVTGPRSATPPWTTASASAPTRRSAADLRQARAGRAQELLLALAAAAALPADPGGPARRLRLRAGVSPVRGLRHPGVRPASGRAGVLRAAHPRPPGRGPTGLGVADLHRRITSRTPGTFRAKVITRDVDPQVNCYYKSSRIKQYFKEHRALRTETVVCDTRDFGIGQRVTAENWRALRLVGEAANQRLYDAQAADARPAPDVVTFAEVTRPSSTDGQHAPGLRFGDPPGDGGDGRPRRVHPPARRLRQPHPGSTRRNPDRRALYQPTSHLRPAPTQTQRADHPVARQPPLPADPPRAARRGPIHQSLRAGPCSRTGHARSPATRRNSPNAVRWPPPGDTSTAAWRSSSTTDSPPPETWSDRELRRGQAKLAEPDDAGSTNSAASARSPGSAKSAAERHTLQPVVAVTRRSVYSRCCSDTARTDAGASRGISSPGRSSSRRQGSTVTG